VKDYDCGCCKGFHDDEEEVKYVKLENDMIEEVQEFCCLGDAVGSSGDVQSLVTARICASWRKFSELSQVLCGRVVMYRYQNFARDRY